MTVENRTLREKIYHIIDNEEEQSFASNSFEIFITGLILISIVTIVLESFKGISEIYGAYFNIFESTTLIVFTLEYLLRIWTADFKYKDSTSWMDAAKQFVFSGSGLVDLLAISPVIFQFTSFWGKQDLRFIRILKITRLLRVFKMNSFTNSITVIVDVCKEKKHDLGITMFVTGILLFVSATLMWYLEGDKQPEQFPNILATLWWAIATLTTVGYGDVYPITPWGKVMAGIIALLGIGMVALPAGILSSAFIEKLEDGTIKEEEIDNYVPKGVLPQAQFQKINSKQAPNPDAQLGEQAPIAQKTIGGDCKSKFGTAFVYCPYCGKKMEEHD